MEHQDFDDLSRALAIPGSRRQAAGMVAGLLGLGLLGVEGADGASKRKRRRQRRRRKRERERRQDQDNLSWESDADLTPAECAERLSGFGCTFGRVGLADAWSCPSDTVIDRHLVGCNLAGAQMQETLIDGWLFNAILDDADFSGARFRARIFQRVSMVRTRFVRAYMPGAWFSHDIDMRGADFTYATLAYANIERAANLTGAIFEEADLRQVSWCPGAICPDGQSNPDITSVGCCDQLNGWQTPYCIPNENQWC